MIGFQVWKNIRQKNICKRAWEFSFNIQIIRQAESKNFVLYVWHGVKPYNFSLPEIDHIIFATQIEYFMNEAVFCYKKLLSSVLENTMSNTVIILMDQLPKVP